MTICGHDKSRKIMFCYSYYHNAIAHMGSCLCSDLFFIFLQQSSRHLSKISKQEAVGQQFSQRPPLQTVIKDSTKMLIRSLGKKNIQASSESQQSLLSVVD